MLWLTHFIRWFWINAVLTLGNFVLNSVPLLPGGNYSNTSATSALLVISFCNFFLKETITEMVLRNRSTRAASPLQ